MKYFRIIAEIMPLVADNFQFPIPDSSFRLPPNRDGVGPVKRTMVRSHDIFRIF